MLVVPAATAQLLCNRLAPMVIVAMAAGCVIAVVGVLGADHLDTSVPGMMAAAGGGLFAFTVVLSPSHGLISRFYRRTRLSLRIASEDVLMEMWNAREKDGEESRVRGRWRIAAIWTLWLRGWLTSPRRSAQPTERGTRLARALEKRRQLWKRFLKRQLLTPEDHLYDPAHRIEHHLDSELSERISRELDQEEGDSSS